MTEWNEQLLTGGSGFLAYRLMIEGWPHQWVTDPRITHQIGLGTRKVYPGLQYDGLRISERVVLREAWPEVDGITVTIVPSDANEDTVNGFTRDPKVVAVLTQDLDATASTWTTRRELGLGVYHLGSECVLANESTIVRGYWDSVPQEHAVTDFTSENPVSIYNWPPTMEGRHAFLYAYGPSDHPESDGQIVWRGVVLRPPRMNSDGLSWQIELGPITTQFDQNVGASEEFEYKVRGVYHSAACPLRMGIESFDVDFSNVGLVILNPMYGFYETEDAFASAVTTEMIAAIAAQATGGLLDINTPDFAYNGPSRIDPSPGRYTVYLGFSGGGSDDYDVTVGVMDALDGCTNRGCQGSPDANGSSPREGRMSFYAGDVSGKWYCDFRPQSTPMGYPLPAARTLVGKPTLRIDRDAPRDYKLFRPYGVDDEITWPNNRVYLEKVDGLQVDDVLLVRNGDDAGRYLRITGINALEAERWIYVEFIGNTDVLYITSESSIIPVRTYSDDGNWADFINALVEQSPKANLGKTPWLTDRDVDTTNWLGYWRTYSFQNYWRHRTYQFSKQVRIRDVFAPELMATGWMARLALDGRLDVAPMPFIASQRSADWALTDDEILLPAEEQSGTWPTWEAQADGLVNIAKLRLGYDPNDDSFDEAQDYTVRMTQSIAEHKSGNRALQEIEIRSQPATVGTTEIRVGGFTLKQTRRYGISADLVVEMALPYLRTLAQDYAIVTVAVPFTLFGVLVGDIVEVTSRFIPDGLGGRGVTGKKAICVGRTWNLDPAAEGMGTLTLWFARDSGRVAGYAPTARIGASVDHGGDLFTLNLNPVIGDNVAWSESGDDVAKHFAVGDAVQLVQADTDSPTTAQGTITAKPDVTHVTIQFDDPWDRGFAVWDLRFLIGIGEDLHIMATERQAAYCWIAGEDGEYMFDFYPLNFPAAREFV